MLYKYLIAVVGCVIHAAIVSGLYYFGRSVSNVVWFMLGLLILWPFWAVFLWHYSADKKVLVRIVATVGPVILGFVILGCSGLLTYLAWALSGGLHQ